jgi:hypothetical protein
MTVHASDESRFSDISGNMGDDVNGHHCKGSSQAMNIHSQTEISPLHSLFRVRK